MSDTPTVILKATRIATIVQRGELLVFAYMPTAASVIALKSRHATKVSFRLDLHDETGEWTSGARWMSAACEVSDDQKMLTLTLVKPE